MVSTFPKLVLRRIFYYLTPQELLTCTLVCKNFLRAFRVDPILKHRIDLLASGFIDAWPGERTGDDIFQSHRRLQEGWWNLTWSGKMKITLLPGCFDIRTSGGILCQLITTPHNTNVLSFTHLPTRNHYDCASSWRSPELRGNLFDVLMDAGQDLLIMMEIKADAGLLQTCSVRLHLFSLSAIKTHPEFRTNVGYLEHEFRSPKMPTIKTRVFGSHVGALHTLGDDNELVLWNWRKGTKISVLRMPRSQLQSFVFVSEKLIVITSVHPGTGVASLQLLSFTEGGRLGMRESRPRLLAEFQLPILARPFAFTHVTFTTDCAPSSQMTPTTLANHNDWTHDARTSVPAFEHQLLHLTITVKKPGFRTAPAAMRRMSLFVHARHLVQFSDTSLRHAIISWDRWSEGTRMVTTFPNNQWTAQRATPKRVGHLHGQRYMTLLENGSLFMLDFNTVGFRRGKDKTLLSATAHAHPQHMPRTIAAGALFKEEVTTALPYRQIATYEAFKYSDLMIDDERIIAFSRAKPNEIDIFIV
ncbi:hypothetical protein BOTBODRAFT_145467 [Botryobasidium botryosum FD-172 SS1]|uniref:F-box domain-containing protein n=1 Tax=Botryobasidium botryosum (strain FD-172 SS1) TaxID=930990 RepID=A0A067MTR6_BOTB1|nr:hypothetical protein BOTBODRAFT_145467 [Botryobasidium botryosum FD-172 SS1]